MLPPAVTFGWQSLALHAHRVVPSYLCKEGPLYVWQYSCGVGEVPDLVMCLSGTRAPPCVWVAVCGGVCAWWWSPVPAQFMHPWLGGQQKACVEAQAGSGWVGDLVQRVLHTMCMACKRFALVCSETAAPQT